MEISAQKSIETYNASFISYAMRNKTILDYIWDNSLVMVELVISTLLHSRLIRPNETQDIDNLMPWQHIN